MPNNYHEYVIDKNKLHNLIKGMKRIWYESVMDFNENTMRASCSDDGDTSLYVLEVPKEGFKDYAEGEKIRVGWDLSRLDDILKKTKGDEIELKIDDDKTELHTKHTQIGLRNYSISSIKDGENKPDMDTTCTAILDSNEFKQRLEAHELINNIVVFKASPGDKKLTMYTEGGNNNEIKTEIGEITDIKQPTKSKYDLERLMEISKSKKINDSVKISYRTEYPLELDYGEIEYMLAPRLDKQTM